MATKNFSRKSSYHKSDTDNSKNENMDYTSSSSREMRNRAEKQRRDKINHQITELSQMNPLVVGLEKKLDKTSVLRLSAAYLRLHKTIYYDAHRNQQCYWCQKVTSAGEDGVGTAPSTFNGGDAVVSPVEAQSSALVNVPNSIKKEKILRPYVNGNNQVQRRTTASDIFASFPSDLSDMFLENMEGFMIILLATGKIVFVSHNIHKILGHMQTDLMGHSIYSITCPTDHDELRKNLQPDPQSSPAGLSSSPHVEQRRSFYLKMAQHATTRGEKTAYEQVHIIGNLRIPCHPQQESAVASSTQLARKSARHRDGNQDKSNQEIVLVAIVKRALDYHYEISMISLNKDEYFTRHTLDGTIVSTDHRISLVAGYMAEEVTMVSAFNYMHRDDIKWVLVSLRQMYTRGGGFGSSVYRLLSKTGDFIYLRSYGHLELEESVSKPDNFICVNTVLTEEEWVDGMKDMRNRFSVYTNKIEELMKLTLSMRDNSRLTLDAEEVATLLRAQIGDDPTPMFDLTRAPPNDTEYRKFMMASRALPAPPPTRLSVSPRRREPSLSEHSHPSPPSRTATSGCYSSPSPMPPSPSHSDPMVAGGTSTCYVRKLPEEQPRAKLLLLETSVIGQVTSCTVEGGNNGLNNNNNINQHQQRRGRPPRVNKRGLSDDSVEDSAKRTCPDLLFTGQDLSPTNSVLSTDMLLDLDDSEVFQDLLLTELIPNMKSNGRDSPSLQSSTAITGDVHMEDPNATTVLVQNLKCNKQTDIGV